LRRSRRSFERCDDRRLRGIVFIVQESIHGTISRATKLAKTLWP